MDAYPKIELHLHLDCCLSYQAVSRLNPTISENVYQEKFLLPAHCRGLPEFLSRVPNSLSLLQTPEGLRVAVEDVFQQLKADNVVYAELRFAPLQHLENGLASEKVVEIVEKAVDRCCREYGINARLILCTLRHFSEAEGFETVKLIEKFQGSRVAALDLAGDEAGFPLAAHIPAFEYARNQQIYRTAHAGESVGAKSVWETLTHLQPSRIGHGVRSIEDERLISHLKAEKIHLEVCPICNVRINIFDSYANHPIDDLYRKGISVGVNCDGRALPENSLVQEYEKLTKVFGWQKEDFLACNLNALEAAFIPENEKDLLKDVLHASYH